MRAARLQPNKRPFDGANITYEQKIEAAIEDGNVDLLVQYAYGYPCKCTKLKGEPLCVCKMFGEALRKKVVPRLLFQNRIERVDSANY